MKKHLIDATNKTVGHIASEAAKYLSGKMSTSYARNVINGNPVHIENASKARTTAKKLRQTIYKRYSGYPGGLKAESMSQLSVRKGMSAVIRRAVNGMLPINKLRTKIMKNLTITD